MPTLLTYLAAYLIVALPLTFAVGYIIRWGAGSEE